MARPTDPTPGQSVWSEWLQDVAAVGWPSFLVAAAATMIVFAFFDPVLLAEATPQGWHISRLAGYSIGFFFLWIVTAASSSVTLYLIRTRHSPPEGPARMAPESSFKDKR